MLTLDADVNAVVGHSIIHFYFFLSKSGGATALPTQMVVTPMSVRTRTTHARQA